MEKKGKRFHFGKVAYAGARRRINAVEVEVRFENGEFTACGYIFNSTQTQCLSGGQNLDTINRYIGNHPTFKTIYNLWKAYHLNGLRSGTHKQLNELNKYHEKIGGCRSYEDDCRHLKGVGLYYDKIAEGEIWKWHKVGDEYEYGTAWLTHTIPQEDVKTIQELIK